MSYPGFGNGFDGSSMGDMGFQAPENQSQWQFNGTGNSAIRQNTFGGIQGMQNTDIVVSTVAGASEAILERNAFYMGLKTVASNRATEIEALKGTIDQKTQEIVDQRQADRFIEGALGSIDKFAREYHTLKDAGGDEGQITFLTDLGPMPAPWKRSENPEVTIWMKREFALAAAKAKAEKGESSGDPSDTNKTKGKAGCPSKKDQDECRDAWQYEHQSKIHLGLPPQEGGWPPLRSASCRGTCPTCTYAPCSRDPKFNFLLLCDDATWKLREWSIQNYSGWAGNRGLRLPVKNTDENAGRIVDALDEPWPLIRMKSSDWNWTNPTTAYNQLTMDRRATTTGSRRQHQGQKTQVSPQPDDDPKEKPRPINTTGPIVPWGAPPTHQLKSRTRGIKFVSGNSHRSDESRPTPHRSSVPRAPVQTSEDATTAAQTHAATSGTLGEASGAATTETLPDSDDPSQPTVTTPPGDPAATDQWGDSASMPNQTHSPTIRNGADTDGRSIRRPTPIPPHPIPTPADAPIPNLRLERAMANAEKKRKAEGRTAAATSKKQKTATTLAEPTGTITINGTNSNQAVKVSPTDFDAYFKGLSDADKSLGSSEEWEGDSESGLDSVSSEDSDNDDMDREELKLTVDQANMPQKHVAEFQSADLHHRLAIDGLSQETKEKYRAQAKKWTEDIPPPQQQQKMTQKYGMSTFQEFTWYVYSQYGMWVAILGAYQDGEGDPSIML
ncbi:hypothetical protein EDB83DRAFT_2536363 [Lactarius deliciosus]|nr:hypothetical protein EDB83DRAFT_2536363 [Lactarius deliciosus]